MDCPLKNGAADVQAVEIFVAYSARTLGPEEEWALVQHLESCSACRSMAAAQQQVWAALDAWTPAPVDSNFDARLYSRIAADREMAWWRRPLTLNWSWKPAMPVAAACAALLAAFLIKSPVQEHQALVRVQPGVDIEQVERALDDIDMLKQIGVASISVPGKPVRSQQL
ncbi:MAG: zf-HC2 domain-containing protein [Bryobacteraceae bacterium]